MLFAPHCSAAVPHPAKGVVDPAQPMLAVAQKGGERMLIIYVAALFGIFRFRGREYWKWLAILFAWMLSAQLLFAGGGTLEDPSGDGLIARQFRLATNDGPGMGIFAIAFIIVYWGGAIWLLRRMYLAGKQAEEERLGREGDTGEEVSIGRKVTEAAAATLIAAVYIDFAFVLPPSTAQSTLPAMTTVPSQPESGDPIAAELAQAADELNREGRMQIDPITTLERVTAEGRVFTYHYQISRREGTDEQLRDFVRQNAVSSACRDPDMMQAMKDYGVTYRYSYMMPNATDPLVVEATYSDCSSLGIGG